MTKIDVQWKAHRLMQGTKKALRKAARVVSETTYYAADVPADAMKKAWADQKVRKVQRVQRHRAR